MPDAPLTGLRVIEVEPSVAVRFAGKWLAALGAEVFKVESTHEGPVSQPNQESGEDSARTLYLDTAKKSASFDLSRAAERAQLHQLVATSDLLLAGAGPAGLSARGLDLDALRHANPALVSVSITPFGDEGPYAELPATPLTLAALSGLLWHVGPPGRAPLALWGGQPEYLGGLHAFGAALTGVFGARATGRGRHLDVSLQSCAAAVVGHHTARVSQGGDGWPRRWPRPLWSIYPTADGWAGISALARNHARLAEVTGVAEIAEASPFFDHNSNLEETARLKALLGAWFATKTCDEVSELALRERVPLGSVLSIEQLAGSQQLAERGFFAEDDHPSAGHLISPAQLWSSDAHGWRYERAPHPGAHTAEAREPERSTTFIRTPEDALATGGHQRNSNHPSAASHPTSGTEEGDSEQPRGLLDGVRILDLGQVWAGPYASMLLAEHGADVIRVESPTAWDPNRCNAPPAGVRDTDWWNTCPYYHEYNHNKRSLGLDLRAPRGREVFARLVARSDVIIENLRADVLDRLGIGYEWLREQRDDIILVSMTGFGRTGSERVLPGYGPMIEQLSGIAGLTAYEDGIPQITTGYAYGDPVAAVAAASAALHALIQRQQTGKGQHIDLAQRDVTSALIGEAFVSWSMSGEEPRTVGNGRIGCAPHGVYPCLGFDEWVAIAVTDDLQWRGLRTAMGDPAFASDPDLSDPKLRYARRHELDERVGEWTRELTKAEVFERCRAQQVPCGPVWKVAEMLEDPQLRAQNFYEWTSHPAVGRWASHGWVWRPAGAGPCLQRAAPNFGGDNESVLRELLGLERAEIEQLEREGIIADEPVGLPELPPD